MALDNALALGSRVTAAFGQSYATSEEWASLLASRYGAESVGGSAGDGVGGIPASESWANPATLAKHFTDHGSDFGATSAEDYANQASNFLQRTQQEGLPTKIDSNGIIRIYDPETNTFGAYNPNGTTKTYFKPPAGIDYWNRQSGVAPTSVGGQ